MDLPGCCSLCLWENAVFAMAGLGRLLPYLELDVRPCFQGLPATRDQQARTLVKVGEIKSSPSGNAPAPPCCQMLIMTECNWCQLSHS